MKKRILLIGSPLSEGNRNYIPDTITDIANYYNYFTSALGGAFLPDEEIKWLINPTRAQILKWVKQSANSSINIIVFSGHGFIDAYNNQFIQINDNESMSIKKLYNNSKRQVLIYDTCRANQALQSFSGVGDIGFTFDTRNLILSRKLYDHFLKNSPSGRFQLFSSELKKYSYITTNGSTYSNSLIGYIINWYNSNSTVKLSLENAFYGAKEYVFRAGNRQIPNALTTSEFYKVFPFAINPIKQIINYRRASSSF